MRWHANLLQVLDKKTSELQCSYSLSVGETVSAVGSGQINFLDVVATRLWLALLGQLKESFV
jgi:hypothetical protein